MRGCVGEMSLLIPSAFISLEIRLHLLSPRAPTSDPGVPRWERQAAGASQTGRRAELPNHIPSLPPSLPTTVSISLLSSHPPPPPPAPPPPSVLERGCRQAGDESAALCLELLVFSRSSSGYLSGAPTGAPTTTTAGCVDV